MKRLYTLLIAIIAGLGMNAQMTYSVTLEVDMNNETVSANGVHVAGNFNDPDGDTNPDNPDYPQWAADGIMLTDDDTDGVYSVTLDLVPGNYEFKFINDNDWAGVEDVPNACQVEVNGNDNRYLTVSDMDTGLSTCFASCGPCGMYTLRFRVDMSLEDAINPDGVHVAGSFQGTWDPGASMLSDGDGDLVYEHYFSFDGSVIVDDMIQYKYINGNTWEDPNEFLNDCGDEFGNRTIEITEMNQVIDVYCFNQCGPCLQPTAVTFRVDMSNETVSADGVHMAGAFQGWDPSATELLDDDTDDIYEVTLDIAPGTYEYKFINGDSWDAPDVNEQPPAECNVNNNREITIGTDPMTVTFCFNQCTETCVADPDPADITFRVNMMEETVSADGVWLIGGFTDPQWQAGATEMTDDDTDGIYEATLNVSGSAEIFYKFTNGDPYPDGNVDPTVEEMADFETLGCGISNGIGGWNRTHVRSGSDEVLDVVCYDDCEDCVVGLGESSAVSFVVYPNPATDNINVVVEGAGLLQVFNTIGQLVETISVLNSGIISIDSSDWERGMYTLKMISNQEMATKNVVLR